MISVASPLFLGNEKKYLQECIDSGWISSDGYFVQKFEEEFAKWSGNDYAITVCNGTAALETALWARGIISSKVLLSTASIISCAIAVLRTKSSLVFYDYNNLVTYRHQSNTNTSFLIYHPFGHYIDFKGNCPCVEDSSQFWQPFKVNDVACYSLYANKLISSGEGGVIVTNNKDVYERAKSYRNLCHSKERFIHNEIGYNFRLSNLQAAVALAQLEQIDKFTEIKQRNRDLYIKYMPESVNVLFNVSVPWMYLISTSKDAGEMTQKLKERGIDTRRFFYPLHLQPCFKGKYEHLDLPASVEAWKHSFYLPSGLILTEKEIEYICKSLQEVLKLIN